MALKYSNTRVATVVDSYEDLGIVAKMIGKRMMEDFQEVWIFGSRSRGNYQYHSDFDFAVVDGVETLEFYEKMKLKQKQYTEEFGVKVDIRKGFYFKNYNKGIKMQ